MGNSTLFGIIFSKNFKKNTTLGFTDKVKIVKTYIPEKVKRYIEKNLLDELKYFQKKYLFKIEILSDEMLVIPEYKIDLFNKSKKIINTIENINKIFNVKKIIDKKTKIEKKLNQKEECWY